MIGRDLATGDGGQAAVIVALAVAVLLGALAFVVDWGFGLTLRRAGQNEADSAALAVGRLLATTVLQVSDTGATFGASQQEAWCAARGFRDLNRRLDPATAGETLGLSFLAADGTSLGDSVSNANCPPTGIGTAVPPRTAYARVVASTSYRTFFGFVTGQSQLTTSASARVLLSGAPVSQNAPVWPLARHFNALDFGGSPCGESCNPNSLDPLVLWRPGAPGFGQFKGLLEVSHTSSRAGNVHQYETRSDDTGSLHAQPPAAPVANRSADLSCPATWDTEGDADRGTFGRGCSIPNWFYYGYRGQLRLATDWSLDPFATYAAGNPPPTPLANARSSCSAPSYFQAPSCSLSPSTLGDWIETSPGDLDANTVARIADFVRNNGRALSHSNDVVARGLNANGSGRFGKAVVVHLFLWDCGERWTGSTWQLIGDATGCASPSELVTPDRVHLFSAVPITVYEGLVSTTAVEAYWGDAFGDPNSCRACALNPLSNTAFLVPDE